MIASLGFISAALLFGIFAYSAGMVKNYSEIKNSSVVNAYNFLSLACITWAAGAFIGTTNSLKISVLIGSIFLVGATIFIIHAVIPAKWSLLALIASLVIGLAYLSVRFFVLQPEPFLQDGVLIFNTQKSVGIALIGVFTLVWLPAMMRYVRTITEANNIFFMTSTGIIACVVALFGLISFLSAELVQGIILSFIVLCCAYLPLIYINYLASKQG